MQRKASAVWRGNLQQGQGEISTESGVLNRTPYSFSKRFGNVPGTNPEELIGAAHSSCFAMALSGALSAKGFTAESLEVSATVTLEKSGNDWTVTASHLDLSAKVPGLDQTQFNTIAEDAKNNCPISRLLDTEISLEARLDEGEARVSH
ncbi:MAG: OsmC family protein [Bdellovibrio sp.]|nr:OsmC family protein [Bdellovibrio sp.]